MRKVKKTVCILAAILILFALTGCGGNVDGKRDLKVWCVAPLVSNYESTLQLSPNDKHAKLTKIIVEKFEKENPNVNLVLENKGWGVKLNSQLLSGLNSSGESAPDIVTMEESLNIFIQSKTLAEIKLPQTIKDDIIDQAKPLIEQGGKIYAVPVATSCFSLNVNLKSMRESKILTSDNEVNPDWRAVMPAYIQRAQTLGYTVNDAATIDPVQPATWEDLLAVCLYVRDWYDLKVEVGGVKFDGANGGNRGGMMIENRSGNSNWNALPFMKTANGDFADPATGKVTIDTPANKIAFQMMRELYEVAGEACVIPMNIEYLRNFYDYGTYALQGGEAVVRTEKYGFERKNVKAVKLPQFASVGINSNSMVGSMFLAQNAKKTVNHDIGLKFIEFLLSEEVQLLFNEYDARIPTRKSVLASETLKSQDNYKDLKPMFDMFETWKFTGQLYGFVNNPSQIWEAWDTFVGKLYSSENLAQAMSKAQADMQSAAEKH